jgi:hypothetical protein
MTHFVDAILPETLEGKFNRTPVQGQKAAGVKGSSTAKS